MRRLAVGLILAVVATLGTSSSALAARTSTKLTVALSGGGRTGEDITVPMNTEVTDSATLSGKDASTATGMIEFTVYAGDNDCNKEHATIFLGDPKTVRSGIAISDGLQFGEDGPVSWRASYLGDASHLPSMSVCEIETVGKAMCTANSATVTLSPGLTDTAAVQTMKVKGTLKGCAGEPFKETRYTATLKTSSPVACSVLKAAGVPATGEASYAWSPKALASTGTLKLGLTETPGAAFSAAFEAGSYSPLTFSGTLTESYTGGATCGQAVGKAAVKAVKKGTFSGSAVSFE